MWSPADFKKEIEARLTKYLSRDSTGIRHEVLAFFVRIKSTTIPELYTRLSRTFTTTYHSVASMVGIIASRMGILHVKRDQDGPNAVYQIKEEYVCMVARLLECG
ncbi:MAG: hypothetical protein PWP08_1036 [Methanofollis sp.]|nr:hypothetical protein [Methanofollis sp.]